MKKINFKRLLLLVAIIAIGFSAKAQFVTTHAKTATPGQQNGIYYSLPETVLRFDFIIEETNSFAGPYVDYASRFLGTNDVVRYNTTKYKIVDVVLSSSTDMDPNATFFVSFDGKTKNPISFNMMQNGVILSVGENNFDVESESKTSKTVVSNYSENSYQYSLSNNTYQKVDSVIRKITIDTTVIFKNIYSASMGSKPMELNAKAAAEKIDQIRDARFKLLSGYQEVGYEGATIQLMNDELLALENDYIALFVGKKVTRMIEKSIFVIPSKEVATMTVAKFSEYDGLTSGTTGNGDPITVQTLSFQNTAKINAPSQSAVETASHNNKLFYRIPEMANVKVAYKGKVLLEQRQSVNQLGVLLLAPFNGNKMVFDPITGQILNISRD